MYNNYVASTKPYGSEHDKIAGPKEINESDFKPIARQSNNFESTGKLVSIDSS